MIHHNDILLLCWSVDHMYGILMDAGTEGHTMHGGGHVERPGAFYRYRDGLMRCGLCVASWQLTDQLAGDGGFAVVPGALLRSRFASSRFHLFQICVTS